jgi:protein MPE1
VIAEPDKASWEQFQAKANKSAAAQQEVDIGLKEIRDKGLACPIDKRLFVDPTKTPCCQKTYCNECITNALLDDGLQCPNCEKEGVLIDDLQPDTEMATRVREYEEEKAKQTKKETTVESPKEARGSEDATSPDKTADQSIGDTSKQEGGESKGDDDKGTPSDEGSKKRKADTELENDRKSPGPKSDANEEPSSPQNAPKFPPELDFMNQPPFANGGAIPNLPNMNMMPMNPMMFAQMMAMQGNMGWGAPNQMNPQQQMGGMNAQGQQMGQHQPNAIQGVPTGPRAQRNTFQGGGRNQGEDSAYFRQPVNPRRGRGGRNFQRPPDYREV